MWGFQDSAVNTHSQEILGFEFGPDQKEPIKSQGLKMISDETKEE